VLVVRVSPVPLAMMAQTHHSLVQALRHSLESAAVVVVSWLRQVDSVSLLSGLRVP
jgi:hypothetical protein